MPDSLELFRAHRVVAIVQAPDRGELIARAEAAARGGIRLLALPVTVPFVAEIAAEIADRTDAIVGLADVVEPEHLNIALAAGVEFVLSPVFDDELVRSCRQRGLAALPAVATPNELVTVSRSHDGPVGVYPVGPLGGAAYFERLLRVRPSVALVACGGLGPDTGPQLLEAGALAVVVDQGLFPAEREPAAHDIIAARASALAEMCAEAANLVRR